jgi:hypothetical protein
MKKLFILYLIILFLISCSNNITKQPGETDPLKFFFNLCVSDIGKAKKVILDNDLVKNLSHLQNMDRGGKKYYLLERESITKMLKSVTEGLYSDYILINQTGFVIYSMVKDEFFGKSVKSSLKNSALGKCHINHELEYYIEDSYLTSERDAEKFFYLSSAVQGGNSNPGVIILEIDPQKILELTGVKSRILNLKGEIIISENNNEIGKPFNHIELLNLNPVYNKIFSFKADKIRYRYKFFKYLNIEWIILNEL